MVNRSPTASRPPRGNQSRTAAHFHGPAAPGIGAGVAVPIGGKALTRSVQHGTVTETGAQVKDRHAGR
jgi:hypothetical protein